MNCREQLKAFPIGTLILWKNFYSEWELIKIDEIRVFWTNIGPGAYYNTTSTAVIDSLGNNQQLIDYLIPDQHKALSCQCHYYYQLLGFERNPSCQK